MRTMSRLPRKRGGFTVVEMLIYMVIAAVVGTAIYKLLISQNRSYVKQRELQDVRGTLRAAANLLAAELRQASSADGDLYAIDSSGFTVRSIVGVGIVCAKHSKQARYGLWGTSGYFDETLADSALVFAQGAQFLEDDRWSVLSLKRVWSPAVGGIPNCLWADSSTYKPDLVVQLDSTGGFSGGIEPGSPLRAFRKVEYSLMESDGRWWLGSKVGSAAGFEVLTGPLSAGDGLQLVYYDSTGVATADPSLVRFVDIKLRGESQGRVHKAGGTKVQEDTLTMRVSLRG